MPPSPATFSIGRWCKMSNVLKEYKNCYWDFHKYTRRKNAQLHELEKFVTALPESCYPLIDWTLFLTNPAHIMFRPCDPKGEKSRELTHLLSIRFGIRFELTKARDDGTKDYEGKYGSILVTVREADTCEMEKVPGSDRVQWNYRCKEAAI